MNRRFSLLEILVSTAILLVLGLMLVGMVRQSLQIYQQAESRKHQYQTIQLLEELLREDVAHLFTEEHVQSSQERIFFLAEVPTFSSTPRLSFVRTIKEEQADPLLRKAGCAPKEEGWSETFTMQFDQEKKLQAPGGLQEVFYTLGTGNTLYRGVRSPIGGKESWAHFMEEDFSKIQTRLVPVCGRVLYFGARFWGPATKSWEWDTPQGGGPHWNWDSTRTRLSRFYYHTKRPSAVPLFPKKIQFFILLDAESPNEIETQLTAGIQEQDLIVPVQSTAGFVFPSEGACYIQIEEEWMEVKEISAFQFTLKKRGALNTKAKKHATTSLETLLNGSVKRGPTKIRQGVAFLMTFHVPTHTQRWDD